MFGELFSVLAIPKQISAGEIVNGQLNPLHLTVATTGYRIQSRTLQIPDRFGFFSSGPPRLQVHESFCFSHVVGLVCLGVVFDAFSVFLCGPLRTPISQRLCVWWSLMVVPGVALLWIATANGRCRQPG